MPQYLRVRRRRNAQTATMIRLEGLMEGRKRNREVSEEMEALADLNLQHTAATARKREAPSASATGSNKRRAAVWRRVEQSENWKPEKCRVIDAVLEDDSDDGAEIQQGNTKRRRMSRRLTLVSAASNVAAVEQSCGSIPSGVGAYKILHPLERLVDSSLQEVIVGTKSVAQHWDMCRNEPSFVDNRQKYYSWCNSEAGNILHACALWNDAETAANVLSRQGVDVEKLTQCLDGEGRTPFEVAQMSGHKQVCEVLEAFGGDRTAEDDAFVIDVYCLDEEAVDKKLMAAGGGGASESNQSTSKQRQNDGNDTDDDDDRVTCELLGGVGYWDEKGELVLEIPDGDTDNQHNTEMLDDDADSNSENWDGNDYPDYEEDDDDEDEEFDDDDQVEASFRNYAVNLPPSTSPDSDEFY